MPPPTLMQPIPSSPIPIDLCPIGPKEVAHRLFPILVPILVLASQQAPCRKAVIRSPGTAPRGCSGPEVGVMVGDPGGMEDPAQPPVKPLPASQVWDQASPGSGTGRNMARKTLPPRGEPIPTAAHTPYQPKGFRRRTSVLRQGKSFVSTCWVVALYMPCRQKGQLERAHGTPNFPVENLGSDLNN